MNDLHAEKGDFVGGLTRRDFLGATVAVGGGLVIAFAIPMAEAEPAAFSSPNAFVKIGSDGSIRLVLPYVEMGQGSYTAQVQLLAEELEVEANRVIIEHAPADDKIYGSPLLGAQITGGSASLRGAWMSLRSAGAAAREMLVEAAARKWNVAASGCKAENGQVIHVTSGRKVSYGDVAEAASKLPYPEKPQLKSRNQYKLIGKPLKRLDTPEKINGTAVFGIDARPDGLRYAMVTACPVFGGTLGSVDASAALAIKGVHEVVKIRDAVAVVATNTWVASKGLAALRIKWNEGPNAKLTTADLVKAADRALDKKGLIAVNEGNVAEAEKAAADRYEAVFRLPMLAHATMEPLNCTVHFQGDRCEVWVGSQILGRAHKVAVQASGLPPEKVVVHNHLLGGGFGRRLEVDYVEQAVLIAKQVKGPLKVTWSREEDTRHDYFRYHNHSKVTVGLDSAGRPVSWRHKLVGPNIMARWLPIYQKDNIDLDIVDAASGPYDIPNVWVEFVRHEAPTGLATGNWRGVGPTRNVFIVESVIDDLARKAGKDPLEYRRSLMTKAPRVLATLNLAAEKGGWGKPLPAGWGRGLASFHGFGSYLSFVAEVDASSGRPRVERVVCAVDTGLVVNPDIVKAQIEGGVVFGVSAVLYGRITVSRGRIEQANFDTYPVLRMHEAPKIEVHIVDSAEEPGGVGEPGTCGAIAAVANAYAAATGKPVYSLPLPTTVQKEAV